MCPAPAHITITNSTDSDIDEIFRLYRLATDYQKTQGAVLWPQFDRALVEKEIGEKHQWKMVIENNIACVFATTFSDPLIWMGKDNDPSVYIHRIATNPAYRGNHLVTHIINWAKAFAKSNNKNFIRIDTVGENKKLIAYYQKCGFNFLGLTRLGNAKSLPQHYHNATVSLFEIQLQNES